MALAHKDERTAAATPRNSSAGPGGISLLLIDDDLLSREVLSMLATEAGYRVQAFESAEAAIAALEVAPEPPQAILTDLQMPGLSGASLPATLRACCSRGTRLLAMSGTQPAAQTIAGFDHFLLKPFTIDELTSVLFAPSEQTEDLPVHSTTSIPETATQPAAEAEPANDGFFALVNRQTYESLAQGMPAGQLDALYRMCIDDADRRLQSMQTAHAARDRDAFVSAAHAIKGGCGMVGATELATLAARMEEKGLPEVDDLTPLEEFRAASARLRGMLKTHGLR
jgi:CheY-like chemotaxis protein